MERTKIPVLDISGEDDDDRERGNENWKLLCSKVREACESHGCFLLIYDKIPTSLREDMVVAIKALFDLPEETKSKYRNPKPYRSYLGKCPVVPLHESFGIDDANRFEAAQEFTQLMWPQGNPAFCEILHSMSSKMLELNFTILEKIFQSFGMEEKQYDALVRDSTSIFRVMKYKIPSREDENLGMVAHTDKNALTILCQNDVQGLEVINKEGHWEEVVVPKNAFVVIVGDALKAWSNGRLVAVKHRVVMKGEKERYSFGLFSVPKEGAMIEVPRELVDNEHPLLYRPFKFEDYFSYFVSNLSDDALEIYAGILKNGALLNKWIWRYGEENEALWRSVIAEKYGGCHTDLLPFMFLERYEWISGLILKISFPHVYALAVNKVGKVKEIDGWMNGKWKWRIVLTSSSGWISAWFLKISVFVTI
ncbi:hypothetical protein DITRI_Ditri10aG0165600 [Diplodiscus trichospermus]